MPAEPISAESAGKQIALDDRLDYASLEGEAAVRAVHDIVLEIRSNTNGPLARKVRLYEATLGLAVIPVLLRRLILKLIARRRIRKPLRR